MKEPRPQVSLRELNRWTLARQLLLERADLDPVTAIERLAGLQGQWPRSPYLALWSRLRDFRAETLESALVEGRVVKSNLMRVTLHLVSAAEFHLYRAAIETETQSGWSGSAAAAGESLAAIRAELIARATARPLPRAEALAVMEALAPGMDEMDRRRLWYLLKSAHLVADPVVEEPRRSVALDRRLSFQHDRRFEAAAAHRSGHPAVAADQQACPHRAWGGARGPDHGCERDQRIALAPFVQGRKQISHAVSIRRFGRPSQAGGRAGGAQCPECKSRIPSPSKPRPTGCTSSCST